MKKSYHLSQIFTLSTLIFLGAPLKAETVIRIESDNQQAVTHWGMATMNRPDWGKEWTLGEYPDSMSALYHELGANIVRFHIDYRVGIPGNRQREDLKQAILHATDRGMQWYGLPWSPPIEMKTIEKPNGEVKGELNHLKEGFEDEVAAWLTELVVWLQSEGVQLPVGIGPQNESDFGPPGYPGCIYTAAQMQKTVVELRKALDAAGLEKVLVIADDGAKPTDDMYPGNIQYINSGTVNMMGLQPGGAFDTNAEFRDAVGVVATHTYDLHNNLYNARPEFLAEFHGATQGIGKPLWMTEWEPVEKHTFDDWGIITEMMTHFHRDMSSLGFNAWLHWHLWKGHALGEGTLDEGQCLGRIRSGDVLIYKDVDFGNDPKSLKLRYSTNNKDMKVSVYVGDVSGQVIAQGQLPYTTSGTKVFETVELPLNQVSGVQTLAIRFEAEEFWKEAEFNWFQVDELARVEAENVSGKITVETWTSSVTDCYNMNNRLHAVYDDGTTLQRRPIFYIFKKLWHAAPAGKSYVRRVSSSSSKFRGESKEAVVESSRQDFVAFVTEEQMTLSALNRNDSDETVRIEGLSGTRAELFRYGKADATSVDQDMASVGVVEILDGVIHDLVLPAQSFTIFITNAGVETPSIVWDELNSGPRPGQKATYRDENGFALIDPSAEARRQKALKKYGNKTEGDAETKKPKVQPVPKVVPSVKLSEGGIEGEAMELDNRLQLVDHAAAGGGKLVAVAEGQSIGNAKITVRDEGEKTLRVSLIDGEGTAYVKLYQNGTEVVVWELDANDGQVTIREAVLTLTPGDVLSIKLFGNEQLDRID